MEFIFEILFQFFGEILLQIILELLFELGIRSVQAPFEKPPNPFLAAIGYAFFGLVAGAISLWIFPILFISSYNVQIINLILTPIAAGVAMMLLGTWRSRRGQHVIRLDKFAYGYVFALAMAFCRFGFGG